MKITNWSALAELEEKLFFLKTGSNLHIANNGNPVDEVVIRYKDFYFTVMIDIESGEPTGDFGWTHGSPMTHTPIREFYTAVRDTPTNSKEASTKGGEDE